MSDNNNRAEIEARRTGRTGRVEWSITVGGVERSSFGTSYAEPDNYSSELLLAESVIVEVIRHANDRIAALTAERDAARAEGVREGMTRAREWAACIVEGHFDSPTGRDCAYRIREDSALDPTPAPDGAGDRDAEIEARVEYAVRLEGQIAALTAERDAAWAEGVREGMERAARICDSHAEMHRERPPEHGRLPLARALDAAAVFIRAVAALPTPAPDGEGDRDGED